VIDAAGSHDEKQNNIKLKCADKSFILFNKLLARAFTATTTTGTTDSTVANKLVDSGANFLNSNVANVGMRVENSTDNTETRIIAIDNDTQLSVADDIFITGENYILKWTAPSIIQKVVRETSQNPDGRFIGTGSDAGVRYDIDARMEIEGLDAGGCSAYIQDVRRNTKEDGSTHTALTFPSTTMSKVWKPVYEWISEISELEDLNITKRYFFKSV